MLEKMGHIKNPLSIIAIFAGISEVCGSSILPFIHKDNQLIFIYFLIAFPTLLVLVFFLTLNFNNKVLYAPSDYKNEENFIKISTYDASRLSDIETKLDQSSITSMHLGEYFERVESKIKNVQDIVSTQFQLYYSNSQANQLDQNSINKQLAQLLKKNYLVSVTHFSNVEPFIHRLRQQGYAAEINFGLAKEEIRANFEKHKSIWLGKNIPLEFALDVISVAKNYYKQLQYIYI